MSFSSDPVTLAGQLVGAFADGDVEAMRPLLSEDLRAFVTNAYGGVDEVSGADDYLARVQAMDLPSARFGVEITQAVEVRPDVAMVMVEIHAERAGRTLHNFATHLFYVDERVVSEWWMVEALPAESEAFWSAPH